MMSSVHRRGWDTPTLIAPQSSTPAADCSQGRGAVSLYRVGTKRESEGPAAVPALVAGREVSRRRDGAARLREQLGGPIDVVEAHHLVRRVHVAVGN